eukprot:GGOE01019324.1.p1 GENE.GGOE01019324.1~~GGOE01019324.1.p1  ORF type:complete len:373 (+),score=136.16 GGOE01019324.1:77-1120(+)
MLEPWQRHFLLTCLLLLVAFALLVWLPSQRLPLARALLNASPERPVSVFTAHPFLRDWLIGACAAAISKTAVAPIERVKLLLQTQAANAKVMAGAVEPYKGALDCFARVVREQSIWALWRGNLANVLRYFPTQAFNFMFKNQIRALFPVFDASTRFWSFFASNVLSGSIAGVLTVFIVYPLDYARTRLAADLSKHSEDSEFRGLFDCLAKTIQQHGCSAVYQGFQISIYGIFVYRGVYFGLYDTAKGLLGLAPTTSALHMFLLKWSIAQSVAITAGLICYPFDTVRRRLMVQVGADEQLYKGTFHCFQVIRQQEGCGGFYKGALSNILRGLGAALVLVLYDELQARL